VCLIHHHPFGRPFGSMVVSVEGEDSYIRLGFTEISFFFLRSKGFIFFVASHRLLRNNLLHQGPGLVKVRPYNKIRVVSDSSLSFCVGGWIAE